MKSAYEGRRNVGGSMFAFALTNVGTYENAYLKLQDFVHKNIKYDEEKYVTK